MGLELVFDVYLVQVDIQGWRKGLAFKQTFPMTSILMPLDITIDQARQFEEDPADVYITVN